MLTYPAGGVGIEAALEEAHRVVQEAFFDLYSAYGAAKVRPVIDATVQTIQEKDPRE